METLKTQQQFDLILETMNSFQTRPSNQGDTLIVYQPSKELKEKFDNLSIAYNISGNDIAIYIDGMKGSVFYLNIENFLQHSNLGIATNDYGILEKSIYYDSSKNIFLEAGIVSQQPRLENHLYYLKIKHILLYGVNNDAGDTEVNPLIEYHDTIKRKMVFVTSKGILNIGYEKQVPIFDEEISLKKYYYQLHQGLKAKGYEALFKYEVHDLLKEKLESTRFFELVNNLGLLLRNTDNSFNVYMSNFSFDALKDKVKQEKVKYYNVSKEVLSKIYSQITSLTIVATAAAFATAKVDNVIILIFVGISYLVYSIFILILLITLFKEVEVLHADFCNEKQEIISKSKLDKTVIDREIQAIESRIKNTKNLIFGFSICFILLSILFLMFTFLNILSTSNSISSIPFMILLFVRFFITG